MPELALQSASSNRADAPGLRLFRAFSDPTRLRLLALLWTAAREGDGEVCVCDLTAVLGVPQPTASRHLGYLRRVGLVTCRKEGAWCHYRLCPPSDPLHRRLLATLEVCQAQVPEVAADVKRLRTSGCCAPGTTSAAGCC